MRSDVVIVGGGMAGMSAGIMLSEAGLKTTILERQERIGKKLLLTGSGKCNISNISIDETHYLSDDTDKLRKLTDNFGIDEAREFLKKLGIELCEKNGFLYPVTRQASTVLDALRFKLEENGVETVTDTLVTKLDKKDGRFIINASNGCTYEADRCILACGGLAGVYGEDKTNGYELLKRNGHRINKPYPALVQLLAVEELKAIAGIRCDAKLCLLENGNKIAEEAGELQITEKAFSGIPVFQLSRYMIRPGNYSLKIDFLPFAEAEAVQARYESFREREAEKFFAGWLNKKLAIYLLKMEGVKPSCKTAELTVEDMKKLVNGFKNAVFELKGTNGYRNAQVSGGGVPLTEVNEQLESRLMPGLYILGEMLNVCGECGGYNLHFAMASAYAASRGIICTG